MLYLASRSSRRHELLNQLGLEHRIINVDVLEERGPGESPRQYVERVAGEKALAGWRQVGEATGAVIGADTEVVLDDRVFGKPSCELEAREMIQALAGCVHQVISSVVVAHAGGTNRALSESSVCFAPMSQSQIEDYCAVGEWRGKAGGYAVQGRAAAFIRRLEGSYSGVMGLPLRETAMLLSSLNR